jgi:hypothetical protein
MSLVRLSLASPNSTHALLVVVEVVVDAGEARTHAALQHDDRSGAVDLGEAFKQT